MIKKGLILHPDNLHYYFFARKETNNSLLSLRYSKYGEGPQDHRGTEVVRIEDDGNGVTIKMGTVKLRLDYSQLGELYLALKNFAEQTDFCQSYKTVITKTKRRK